MRGEAYESYGASNTDHDLVLIILDFRKISPSILANLIVIYTSIISGVIVYFVFGFPAIQLKHILLIIAVVERNVLV